MTSLRQRKTKLTFEVEAEVRERGRYRKIVLEPQAGLLDIRLKGTRRRLSISYEAIFDLASKIEANRIRAEKLARRKAR